jgi:uncharacterized protein YecE (DUF72 family)
LKRDAELLSAFCKLLPKGTRAAFEFRHESWFDEATYAVLRDGNFALVAGDTDENEPLPLVRTADWGYLRLRAPSYDAAGIESWSKRLSDQNWDTAYVYFKHEYLGPGYAVRLLDPSAPMPEPAPPAPPKTKKKAPAKKKTAAKAKG